VKSNSAINFQMFESLSIFSLSLSLSLSLSRCASLLLFAGQTRLVLWIPARTRTSCNSDIIRKKRKIKKRAAYILISIFIEEIAR